MMNNLKYSFMSIFENEYEIEIQTEDEEKVKKKVKISKIIIPKIQRDYAQGRKDKNTNRIRTRFLDALYKAIIEEPITLDFIYGDINEDGEFIPLDGQQRLTTLFLLHWYVSKKENIASEECDFLKKFSYETRSSSRDFCEKLVEFTPMSLLDDKKLSDEIINQSWFSLSWKKDQTISSMLVMIDDIKEKFKKLNNIWIKLKEDSITFNFKPLKEMGLSDEIYINMNSRGKPLTSFENFKAEFYEEIKNLDEKRAYSIVNKIDNDWTNMLWNYRELSTNNIIDDLFLNYFYFICDVICYKNNRYSLINKLDELDLLKQLFSQASENMIGSLEENINIFEQYFDCITELSKNVGIKNFFEKYVSSVHEKGKIISDKENKIDYFENCINNYKSFSHGQFVMLYAFITYLLNKDKIEENQFIRRIRIISNLVKNSEDELAIRDLGIGGNSIPLILKQVELIMIKGEITSVKDKDENKLEFNQNQLQEEKEKLEWTRKKSDEECEKLYILEDHELLFGQISIIGLENEELFDRFEKLFNCDLDKVVCALLAIGNYSQVTRGIRYQLGTSNPQIKAPWISLFHKSTRNHNYEQTKAILCELLSKSDEINNEFLQKIIDEYIKDCENNSRYEWRYYFIKYSEFRPGKYGKYGWDDFVNKPYEVTVIKSKERKSDKSYEPFLKVIDEDNVLDTIPYGSSLPFKNYYIESLNDRYIFIDKKNDEEVEFLKIKQDEKGVDIENRVEKIINKIKNMI